MWAGPSRLQHDVAPARPKAPRQHLAERSAVLHGPLVLQPHGEEVVIVRDVRCSHSQGDFLASASLWLRMVDVVLLCGQSNQAGRGGVKDRVWDGVVPAACVPSPRVLCLRPDGAAWEQAQEPLHREIDAPGKPCGVGPGLAFAAALMSARPACRRPLGLVPCAVGGSALREWELPDGELGRRAVVRARAALDVAAAEGGSRLLCLLFYQGETDAMEAADAATWGARFARWVAAVRTELGAPELTVGVVAITASTTACPHLEAVRAAQLRVPAAVPRSFVVDAHGLPLQADGLHLTTEAQVALGQLLARAFLDFQASCAA